MIRRLGEHYQEPRSDDTRPARPCLTILTRSTHQSDWGWRVTIQIARSVHHILPAVTRLYGDRGSGIYFRFTSTYTS